MLWGFQYDLVFKASGLYKMLEATAPGLVELLMMFSVTFGINIAIYRLMEDPQDSIAAMAVLTGLLSVVDNILMAVCSTTSTRASNAIAHSPDPVATKAWVNRGMRAALFLMCSSIGLCVIVCCADSHWFASLFSNDERVVHLAAKCIFPLMMGYLLLGVDQVFLQTYAGCGYFYAVSGKGLFDMAVMVGAMAGALVIRPRLDYLMWAFVAAFVVTLPLCLTIYCFIDWEDATKAAIGKAKEMDEEGSAAGDEEEIRDEEAWIYTSR